MVTYHLGAEEVDAYLSFLISRVFTGVAPPPEIICCVGESGEIVGKRLVQLVKIIAPSRSLLLVNAKMIRKGDVQFSFPLEKNQPATINFAAFFHGKNTLIMDGSVKSGRQMRTVVDAVAGFKANVIHTYAMVLKRGSGFIPSSWGLIIDDYDLAHYYMMSGEAVRLLDTPECQGFARELATQDAKTPALCGWPESELMSWVKLYYERMQKAPQTARAYVFISGEQTVAYFLTEMEGSPPSRFMKLSLITTKGEHAFAGGYALKWAESLGRKADCRAVRLRVERKYEQQFVEMGFDPVPTPGDPNYVLMDYDILHRGAEDD